MKEWTAAQQDTESPLFGTPCPEMPPVFTKDDQQPYKSSQEQATQQFRALLTGAFAAWDQSVLLAKTPEEKAAALYTRGWGRLLFARAWGALNNFDTTAVPADLAKRLDKQGATEDFTALTILFPKEARYWQALGDSFCEVPRLDQNIPACEAALNAYHKSLESKKANVGLWYKVYTLSKDKKPILAEQALGELAAQEPRNAFASYRLAALLMAKTAYIEFHTVIMKALEDHSKRIDAEIQAGNITEQDIRERRRDNFPKFESESKESIAQRLLADGKLAQDEPVMQTAMAKLEEGNQAGNLVAPSYTPPVAPLLVSAWGFSAGMFGEDLMSLLTLSMVSAAEGYAQAATLQGRTPQAMRMLQDVLACGLRRAGALDIHNLPATGSESVRITEGCSDADTIYHELIKAYQAAGDNDTADRIQSEMIAFEGRWRRYMDAYFQSKPHSLGFD